MFQPESKPAVVRAMKKVVEMTMQLLRTGFNPSKCKTEARLATARIKLLRNRRKAQLAQMRRDIAALLQSGHEETARIRVEHVIREHNVMAANEIIELFCELIVVRLPIILKQRACPADLREGISSLIYAAPRCSEIPELCRIRDIFEKKYGKDFVSAATDLRPESGVNLMLIEKLSVRKPTGEVKLKFLKEIAKEYQIQWDSTGSEAELLKPPEEVLDGPSTFISASSMPLRPSLSKSDAQQKESSGSYCVEFKDMASAAQAAADAAGKAAFAAQAAVNFARPSPKQSQHSAYRPQNHSINSVETFASNFSPMVSKPPENFMNSTNIKDEDGISEVDNKNCGNGRRANTDIKFDDSDGLDSDGEDEIQPPRRPPPAVPPRDEDSSDKMFDDYDFASRKLNQCSRVHPKLPDYEELAARFVALRSHKS